MNNYLLTAIVLCGLLTGCIKKTDPIINEPVSGSLTVSLHNMAGGKQLKLDNEWYLNANGDSIKITTFNYFISNIKLVREDGTVFSEQESYHLVQESITSTKTFVINNIPYGKYKSISFLIGVDSARNVSGAQTGALDQSSGMFWDWNTGYIMAKMEAQSPQALSSSGFIVYHLGGFSGDVNVLRTVSLQIPYVLEIANGKIPQLHVNADAMEWFKTPNLIKVKDLNLLAGKSSLLIADNYADMFTIDHVE